MSVQDAIFWIVVLLSINLVFYIHYNYYYLSPSKPIGNEEANSVENEQRKRIGAAIVRSFKIFPRIVNMLVLGNLLTQHYVRVNT